MGVNRFDDLCDKFDAAVFNGDWLFDAENRAIFEEYLRRWDTELRSHGAASESNPDYAALLARHNALREAVEWERECRDVEAWMNRRPWSWGDAEIWASLAAARAEVDRLIANESAADCEGEG